MKRISNLFFALAILLGAAAVAGAQDMPPQGPPPGGGGGGFRGQFQFPQFKDLDKNKDGKISKDEWPSQMPQQFFDRLDTNHDGFIDEAEFNAARNRMGGGPRTGEAMTKLLDADKDGKVTRDEFAKIVALFDLLDANHDGSLSQEELNNFFRAVNEAQTQAATQATGGVDVNALFANNDKNKDGKLTPDEITNERLFKRLDLNKDGVVTREEAETALKQLAEERAKAKKPTQP